MITKYNIANNTKELVRIISENGIRYQVMKNIIRTCTVDYNIIRIHCDKGGGGETIRDLLAEPWIDPRTNIEYDPILDMDEEETENVQGLRYLKLVNFQGSKHATLSTNLKAELEHNRMFFTLTVLRDEDRQIEIANKEIRALKTELAVIKPKPIGASLRFEVPNDFRNDRAVALTLAVDAAMELHIPNWKIKEDEPLAVGFFVGGY